MYKYALAALALLCMLSGCDSTASLQKLRSATPQGDTYSRALADDYRAYADEKEKKYDWWTSKYFADKGLMVAYGRDIEPEDPTRWDTPATQLPEFNDARSKLISTIPLTRNTQPEITANAVVAYDRWLEISHNKWNVAAIEEQRDVFFALLTKLTEAQAVSGADVPTTTIPQESTSTVLYFPFDSDKLGDSANAALAELVRYVQTAGNVTISINGHADRAGTEEYNMHLSERRARFVMQALKAAGVPENLMKYLAFGESDPAVPTADGVREPKNRRVEIFIE